MSSKSRRRAANDACRRPKHGLPKSKSILAFLDFNRLFVFFPDLNVAAIQIDIAFGVVVATDHDFDKERLALTNLRRSFDAQSVGPPEPLRTGSGTVQIGDSRIRCGCQRHHRHRSRCRRSTAPHAARRDGGMDAMAVRIAASKSVPRRSFCSLSTEGDGRAGDSISTTASSAPSLAASSVSSVQ